MKNRIARLTVFGLAACLLLTLPGCASILERSYSSSTPHVDRPATAGDSSAIRVENYRELVSAVLFLVSQGEEEGVIQLQDYAGEVEADLTAACLEVATEDPLGAYAVEYIKHETTRVVSYDQATLTIHYRRTPEQIRSISTVTGTGAIRTELQSALEEFETEVVFRVAYFAEDADFIAGLIRQAYYDTPGAALGMPEAQISLYPDSGSRRVVEILLTYPDPMEELDRKREAVDTALAAFPASGDPEGEEAARRAAAELCARCEYSPEGGATAYAALVEGAADDEGLALAYTLVCRNLQGVTCELVEGTWEGEPRFWNGVHPADGESLYVDLSRTNQPTLFYTAEELAQQGYRWPGAEELTAGE